MAQRKRTARSGDRGQLGFDEQQRVIQDVIARNPPELRALRDRQQRGEDVADEIRGLLWEHLRRHAADTRRARAERGRPKLEAHEIEPAIEALQKRLRPILAGQPPSEAPILDSVEYQSAELVLSAGAAQARELREAGDEGWLDLAEQLQQLCLEMQWSRYVRQTMGDVRLNMVQDHSDCVLENIDRRYLLSEALKWRQAAQRTSGRYLLLERERVAEHFEDSGQRRNAATQSGRVRDGDARDLKGEVIEESKALWERNPSWSAAQIARVLHARAHEGWPGERQIRRIIGPHSRSRRTKKPTP